jgi:hypothetical protein
MKTEEIKSRGRKAKEDLLRLTLIDTSAWILALREGGPARGRDEIDRLIAGNRAATTGIIKLELLAGTRTEKEYKELKQDLESLVQLEVTSKTWESASYLAYGLRRKGITVPSADVLIVAIAAENGCNLIHADHHFDLIAGEGVGFPRSAVIGLLK